jgi:hypothetical protein
MSRRWHVTILFQARIVASPAPPRSRPLTPAYRPGPLQPALQAPSLAPRRPSGRSPNPCLYHVLTLL